MKRTEHSGPIKDRVTHGDQSSIEGGLDGGGLIAAFLTLALTPAATAAAVLGTNTGAFNA